MIESKENNRNCFNFFIESEVSQEQFLFDTECLLGVLCCDIVHFCFLMLEYVFHYRFLSFCASVNYSWVFFLKRSPFILVPHSLFSCFFVAYCFR